MTWQIAGGTVPGSAHLRAEKNGQDAYCWAQSDRALVAFVCDGCGSGKHSEVGARLGARLLTAAAFQRISAGAEPPSPKLWEDVRRDVLARVRDLADAMGDPVRAIADHFLFTLVGFAASPAGVATVSLGDGLIALNGETLQLGPFEGNEPPYLAYSLLGRDLPIRVHHALFEEEVRSAVIATDGAFDFRGPLSELWTEDRYYKNADAIRRRLAVAKRAPGSLPDDTTIVSIRRKP